MLKPKKEEPQEEPQAGSNGGSSEQLRALTGLIQEMSERLEDMESKKDLTGEARLLIATRVFDTDRVHLPEMTVLPLRTVRPYSLADMSASILHPDVQSGKVSLGQVRRESIYRHLRSVGGGLLDKGFNLAMEQSRQADIQDGETSELGG
jgi:hypothetical protein